MVLTRSWVRPSQLPWVTLVTPVESVAAEALVLPSVTATLRQSTLTQQAPAIRAEVEAPLL